MDRKRRARFIVIGIILMLGLLLIPLVTAVIVGQLPRSYFSKSIVEFRPVDPSVRSVDPLVRRKELLSTMSAFGTAGEFQPIRNTDLYELGIWDRNPIDAAMKANEWARSLQQQSSLRIKIWENAEPALIPARPQFLTYSIIGWGLAVLSFGAGTVILLNALLSGNSKGRQLSQ